MDEKQWSPVVYYDAPRCILCYRCVRICGEGLGVNALGIGNRGAASEIVPNRGDHLECDECGACIDICPVGALTCGTYRYKTRPWEMEHVGTICTHCSNGCKTTLGVRNGDIIRANNRDRSGVNGEFLCVKGRYAFDFNAASGAFDSRRWFEHQWRTEARFLGHCAGDGCEEVQRSCAPRTASSASSARTTRPTKRIICCRSLRGRCCGTSNIDHHRTGDVVTLLDALHGQTNALGDHGRPVHHQGRAGDRYRSGARAAAARVINCAPTARHEQGARICGDARAGARRQLRQSPCARNSGRSSRRWKRCARSWPPSRNWSFCSAQPSRAKRFGKLVAFGDSLGIPVKYVCLLDYSNSRGASDMGLLPDLLPGYHA